MEGQRKGTVLVEHEGLFQIKVYPNTTDKISFNQISNGILNFNFRSKFPGSPLLKAS